MDIMAWKIHFKIIDDIDVLNDLNKNTFDKFYLVPQLRTDQSIDLDTNQTKVNSLGI